MPIIATSKTKGQDQLVPALNDPTLNLLRPQQVAETTHDIKVCEEQLKDPRVQDKQGVRSRLRNLQHDFTSQAPRPITDGALKDKLAKEAKDLLDDVRPGMLSQEEMRKNPAGSVDKFMRWERANKPKILRWKKIMTALNADNSHPSTWDRDAANLERFRPESAVDRMRTDAQIGGHMSYGSISEENWATTFGSTEPKNSALNQAKRVASAKE